MPPVTDPNILRELNGGGQQPQPQPRQEDPIIRPAQPTPPPSGYERGPDGSLRPIPGGPADPYRPQPPQPPSGYRATANGGLEPIPGGPADPNRPQPGRDGNAIPQGFATRAETDIGAFVDLTRQLGGFQDDYAGNAITGGLENTAQSILGLGTPGQSEWWADFQQRDNQIRNELFGATLTPSEQQAYAQTSISPRMTAQKVRDNLTRRRQILRGALLRRRDFYLAQGFRQEAVDALFAPLLEAEFADGQAERGQREDPPALGGTAQAQPPADGGMGGVVPTPVGGPGDGRIPGNTHNFGFDTERQEIVRSATARQDNPALAGVQGEYLSRLERGDSAESIIRWAREAGIHPSAYASIAEQVRFRRENPNVSLSEYDVAQLDDRFVAVDPLTQGLGNLSSTALGAYATNAADALTGFNLDSLVGATGGNAEQTRLAMEQIARENPFASTAGMLSGGVMASLGAEAGLGAAGIRAAMPRALAADSAYGAVAGAGVTDYNAEGGPASITDRLAGAATGAVAGLVGSAGGQAIGGALGRGARGVSDPAVQTMRREGVPMTLGQAVGQSGRLGEAVKGVEDRLSGIPIVGDAINARRSEGLRRFNSRIFDRALEPIGGSVGDLVGTDAVEEAQRQVSQSFADALSGVGVIPDQVFERDLSKAVEGVRALDRGTPGLLDDVANIFAQHADDQMLSGEALQMIHRELRDMRLAYRNHPRGQRIGAQIERVERAVFDLFDRQASGTVEAYRKARQAYRRIATVEDAVLKAQNQQDQVFTPAQMTRSDNTATRRLEGRGAAARGAGPFNDLVTAGQQVLPNKVPDSGTAGRLLVPALALGGGATVDAQGGGGMGTGLTIGAILAGLYTKRGQRLLTGATKGLPQGAARRAIESPKTRRALGMGGAGAAGALTTGQ